MVPDERAIRRFGFLMGLWIVLLFLAAIAYRVYYVRTWRDNAYPAPRMRAGVEQPNVQQIEWAATEPAKLPWAGPANPKASTDSPFHFTSYDAQAGDSFPREYDEELAAEFPAGLFSRYVDASGLRVTQETSAPALLLSAGQMPHPRLSPGKFQANWIGAIKVLRSGKYHFTANVAGQLTVRLGGKVVLQANDQLATSKNEPVDLKSGIWLLEIDYQRTNAAARIQLFWEGPNFVREPLSPWSLVRPTTPEWKAWKEAARADHETDRGHELIDRHGCYNCHRISGREGKPIGPDLAAVASRTHNAWLVDRLTNPSELRPDSRMPHVFTSDADGKGEAIAVAAYLASLSAPMPLPPARNPDEQRQHQEEAQRWRQAGQRLFGGLGCAACHAPDSASPVQPVSLRAIADKASPDVLAQFLKNPSQHFPTIRMPGFRLDDEQARDLAYFLTSPDLGKVLTDVKPRRNTDPSSKEGVAALAAQAKVAPHDLVTTGAKLFASKRCSACHTLDNRPTQTAPAKAWAELAKQPVGCLAPRRENHVSAPWFGFSPTDRSAILAVLGSSSPTTPAPVFAVENIIAELRCLACHVRNGKGGLAPTAVALLQRFGSKKENELVLPPPLSGVGAKARRSWLQGVLLEGAAARPYLSIRMPQFGASHVGALVDALPHSEGAESNDAIHAIAFQARDIEDGRYLVSRRAFGCAKCHYIADRKPAGGVLGPDLAFTNQRVHYEWYRRWMSNPQRLDPQTKMPANFTNGKSPITDIHSGDAIKQMDAIWSYLSLGKNLPLEPGNEPPESLTLQVSDRPIVTRTFLPDASPWSIAVGYPQQVSVAYDARRHRLSYAWAGDFLDIGPSWNNRGGQPAHLLGNRIWTGPIGFPWTFQPSPSQPPSFADTLRDPDLYPADRDRLPLPANPRLQFLGYDLDARGSPTFHSLLKDRDPARPALEIDLTPRGLRSASGVGVGQTWTIRPVRKATDSNDKRLLATGWLLVEQSVGPPRTLAPSGDVGAPVVGPEAESKTVDAINLPLTFDNSKGLAPILRADRGKWLFQKIGANWTILLGVPVMETPGEKENQVDLEIWIPYRNDPAMVREILKKAK